MRCEEVREMVYPTPEKCEFTTQTDRALDHIRNCEACREHYRAQEEWSRSLRAKAGSEPAPDALRTLVGRMVAEAATVSAGKLGTRRQWAMAALAGCIVLAAVVWAGSYAGSRLFFQSVLEDHARYTASQPEITASEPREIESWFHGQAGFGVRIPAIDNARLLGGRLCDLRGRRAALVFYRRSERPVSMFLLNDRGISMAALDRWKIDGEPLWKTAWQGYSLAAFRERGLLYVVVSDLREAELVALAASIRTGVRGD